MINILSFFRNKRNIYFVVILVSITIFNSFLYYKYNAVNKKISNNKELFLVVDKSLFNNLNNKYQIEYYILSDNEFNNYIIDYNENKKYYKIYFNKLSLYEKYKKDALVFVSNKSYNNTIKNLQFYRNILLIQNIISIILFFIIIILIIYYEKNNIILLNIIGYKKRKIIQIYFINISLVIIPCLLICIITYLIN
jgi:hypothetical protein